MLAHTLADLDPGLNLHYSGSDEVNFGLADLAVHMALPAGHFVAAVSQHFADPLLQALEMHVFQRTRAGAG